ncbi:WS/DGAT domain-containing protein [Mycobacterium sp. NPDC050551]|uniref:WS/DGAT domain-containing protein n=1 Tax=Mycobacterium sp. NPDC050551 TaxID=3155407 RepID=UPI00341E09B6
MRRLAAADAQTYWLSAKMPSDQFLVYGFAGGPADPREALAPVRERARGCGELRLRVREHSALTYPEWAPAGIDDRQFCVHDLDDRSWPGCLAAVRRLAERQLDAREMTWRLHLFAAVDGIPGAGRPGTVVVLQVAHALADGVRGSALAALLLGRPGGVEPVPVSRFPAARLPVRAVTAARTHRRLLRDVTAGVTPAQADTRPPLRTNARPAGVRYVRTIVRHRRELPGPTVTTGVLAAVSGALAAQLRELGDDPATLGAEVPMAAAGQRLAHNHFGNVGVGLYPELDAPDRARRIAQDLADRRRRAAHPGMRAAGRAFAATPAPLLRWGVAQFDPDVRAPLVIGNTVVSSVHRGPADLSFGGAPVVVTTGFPELSQMVGLAHGVHGVGDTVAISVHAAESAIGDVDAYTARLAAALG